MTLTLLLNVFTGQDEAKPDIENERGLAAVKLTTVRVTKLPL
jgi:hypothetical protein